MRDLEKDLKICEAATPGPWKWELRNRLFTPVAILHDDAITGWVAWEPDAQFITEARTGWQETIRYAMKLEEEVDRLREENAMLLEQLNQRGCGF